jgi:hypothetical protein
MAVPDKSFADYKSEGHHWITLASGEYYPDILPDACLLYQPVLEWFGQLLKTSESSARLLIQIAEIADPWMRVQVARVFRKYVCPSIPVEMLKHKRRAKEICDQFGHYFRPVQEVQAAFMSRPMPDETLCALLWEYKSRGQKGYDLTEHFFELFSAHFPGFTVRGPKHAGTDIRMAALFDDYPNPNRPVDFAIFDVEANQLWAIGLARYDGDRGGAQEDDRTGGYRDCAYEISRYVEQRGLKTKIIFVNDGPGLLLGSMWDDYAALETLWPGRIKVLTLRMVPERLSAEWLKA